MGTVGIGLLDMDAAAIGYKAYASISNLSTVNPTFAVILGVMAVLVIFITTDIVEIPTGLSDLGGSVLPRGDLDSDRTVVGDITGRITGEVEGLRNARRVKARCPCRF